MVGGGDGRSIGGGGEWAAKHKAVKRTTSWLSGIGQGDEKPSKLSLFLDEARRVVKTLVFMAHGDDILTNWHCALLDERAVLRRRDQYLEAEKRGEIAIPDP